VECVAFLAVFVLLCACMSRGTLADVGFCRTRGSGMPSTRGVTAKHLGRLGCTAAAASHQAAAQRVCVCFRVRGEDLRSAA